jgi:hypothetical protein
LGEVEFLTLGKGEVGDVIVGFEGVIEVGHEAEVVVMGDGVVFVSVALGAAGGEAEPGGAGSGDTIDHSMVAELEGIDASLFNMVLRWKPVAMICSEVAFGSISPASCSIVN